MFDQLVVSEIKRTEARRKHAMRQQLEWLDAVGRLEAAVDKAIRERRWGMWETVFSTTYR